MVSGEGYQFPEETVCVNARVATSSILYIVICRAMVEFKVVINAQLWRRTVRVSVSFFPRLHH